MHVKVHATLGPPSERLLAPGPNKPIFTKKTTVLLNPDKLHALYTQGKIIFYEILHCGVEKYDPTTNTFTVSGNMGSGTKEYMEGLRRDGWKLNRKNAQHHGLPTKPQIPK